VDLAESSAEGAPERLRELSLEEAKIVADLPLEARVH